MYIAQGERVAGSHKKFIAPVLRTRSNPQTATTATRDPPLICSWKFTPALNAVNGHKEEDASVLDLRNILTMVGRHENHDTGMCSSELGGYSK